MGTSHVEGNTRSQDRMGAWSWRMISFRRSLLEAASLQRLEEDISLVSWVVKEPLKTPGFYHREKEEVNLRIWEGKS
jgi:hypothetical protein